MEKTMSKLKTLFEWLQSGETHKYAVDAKPFVVAYLSGREPGEDVRGQYMWADPVKDLVQLNDKAESGKIWAVRAALEYAVNQLGGKITWKKYKGKNV
jgi:hypothetical protein